MILFNVAPFQKTLYCKWMPSSDYKTIACLLFLSVCVALPTGCIFKGRASDALQEGVIPLLYGVHSVRHPVPQHEEEVRQPKRLAGGETVQSDIALGRRWIVRHVGLQEIQVVMEVTNIMTNVSKDKCLILIQYL